MIAIGAGIALICGLGAGIGIGIATGKAERLRLVSLKWQVRFKQHLFSVPLCRRLPLFTVL